MPNQIFQFSGCIPAVVTPFDNDEVNFNLAKSLFLRAAYGAEAIVVAGSTGEGTSLSRGERKELFQLAKEAVGEATTVIAGLSAASTREAERGAKEAETAGADALLVSTPYYVKPSQEGIVLHFKAIADAVSIPIVFYNIPSRIGCDASVDSICELWECGAISGLKETAHNSPRVPEIAHRTGSSFKILCGDDSTSFDMLSGGASGTVSVVANLFPELCAAAHSTFESDAEAARPLFARFTHLIAQLGKTPNPTGVKFAAEMLGLCARHCRLPLTDVSPRDAKNIEEALTEFETARRGE